MKALFSLVFFLFVSSSVLISCDSDSEPTPSPKQEVLTNIGQDIIVPTYKDLYLKSEALVSAVKALRAAPNEANLEAVRNAWRATRNPWELSEAFLYGPVAFKGIDPKVDAWPLNELELEAVISSGDTITPEYVNALSETVKGFHTSEYFIFGLDGMKKASAITPRELEYLESVVIDLTNNLKSLYTSWDGSGENYVKNFTKAGTSESQYATSDEALKEVVDGLIAIAAEVSGGKLFDPLDAKDLRFEESRFSSNSTADFSDNIIGVQNVYLGTYGSFNGKGLSAVVAEKNSDLDQSVRRQIAESITALKDMKPTFGWCVMNEPTKVEAAIAATRRLERVLTDSVRVVLFGE